MIKGKVIDVGEEIGFELDGRLLSYRNILFDTGGGKFLRTILYGDKAPPILGETYDLIVQVTSERNKRNPDLWFHKVKLNYYERSKHPVIPEEIFL